MTQNTSAEQSTKPAEPILTEERLSRWCDMFDDMFGIKHAPKNENA